MLRKRLQTNIEQIVVMRTKIVSLEAEHNLLLSQLLPCIINVTANQGLMSYAKSALLKTAATSGIQDNVLSRFAPFRDLKRNF